MSLVSPRLLDAILFGHFEANKHLLGGSLEAFSESLREVNATLALPMRSLLFSDDANVVKRMDTNGKRLRRYADDRTDHRMPAELVLLFIETLKRTAPVAGVQCVSEVCRAVGSLYVPVPDAAAGADMALMSRVAKEFGEFCTAWAPILADGQVNDADLPHLAEAIQQSEDLIGAALAAKAQLEALRERVQPKGALRVVGKS